jgi:hypothetical protein
MMSLGDEDRPVLHFQHLSADSQTSICKKASNQVRSDADSNSEVRACKFQLGGA